MSGQYGTSQRKDTLTALTLVQTYECKHEKKTNVFFKIQQGCWAKCWWLDFPVMFQHTAEVKMIDYSGLKNIFSGETERLNSLWIPQAARVQQSGELYLPRLLWELALDLHPPVTETFSTSLSNTAGPHVSTCVPHTFRWWIEVGVRGLFCSGPMTYIFLIL